MSRLARLGWAILACALMQSTASAALPDAANAGGDTIERQVAAARAAYARARTRAVEAERRSATMDANAAQLRDAAARDAAQAAVLAARVQSAEAALTASQQRLRLATHLRNRQLATLRRQQAPLMDLMARQQLLLRRPPVSLFAEPGSAGQLVHARLMAESIVPLIRQRTAQLRRALDESRRLARLQRDAHQRFSADRTALEQRRSELARSAQQRGAQAARLGGRAGLESDVASALNGRIESLDDIMAAASRRAAERDRLARLPGPVPRPGTVSNGLRGVLASVTRQAPRFQTPVIGDVLRGMGSIDEDGHRARGVTIAASPGAQIVAPAAGRVLFAGPFRSYGQVVIIDHGESWTSLITGLIAVQARSGDQLVAGAPLGRAEPNAPRIGVELRHRGVPADFTAAIQ